MLKRIGILFLLLLVAAAGGAWWMKTRLETPYKGFDAQEVFVDLPSGIGVSAIGERLTDAGVVPDPWTFRLVAHLDHVDRKLQAGEYRFAEPATPHEVAARLARGDVYTHPITFPEGLTSVEMADIFGKSGLGTAAEFRAAAKETSLVADLDPDAESLEGYLFPSTYALARRAGATATVQAMVTEFNKAFDPQLRLDAAARNMTPRDVVTLASIIEKETARPEERPIVSAVYQNRLKIGMPLQCDPTVIYAMMLAGTWNGNIRRTDLQMDSPYNTYRHAGLPPGPIASPGKSSLEAAVHPADVKYLYFVSRNDGTHVFATTLEEHNRNVAKYQIIRRH
ncbi:MAG TPA: endolytic transglycosylase MltG [Vicinamibacterales bacterium]|nr:endolytic transglycosylase MltG [Vicinamibacterales bacterium]